MGCDQYEIDDDDECRFVILRRRSIWVFAAAAIGLCYLAFLVGREYEYAQQRENELAKRLELLEREQQNQREVYEFLVERLK